MTSIPGAISRFSDNNFKRFYLKKERLFVNFSIHFWNVHEIYNIPKKKEVYGGIIITEVIAFERHVYLSV